MSLSATGLHAVRQGRPDLPGRGGRPGVHVHRVQQRRQRQDKGGGQFPDGLRLCHTHVAETSPDHCGELDSWKTISDSKFHEN